MPGARYSKTFDVSDINGAHAAIPDLKVFGDGDSWALLSKASSPAEGWMKSTKAYSIPGIGVVVQVTTQQEGRDGSYSLAEAVVFVPGVRVAADKDDSGKIVGRHLEAF